MADLDMTRVLALALALAVAAPTFAQTPQRYSVALELKDSSAEIDARPSMLVRAGELATMSVSAKEPGKAAGAYAVNATVTPFAQDLVDVEFRVTTDDHPLLIKTRLKVGSPSLVTWEDLSFRVRIDPAP
jgi:hypothetical protein